MPFRLLGNPTQLAYYVPTSMPRIKLTTTCVRELEHPEVGQVIYFDTKLSGFGLRVGRSKKSYFAEKRVDRRTRRVTIGSSDLYSCEQARREAQSIMGKMASGIDPNAERTERCARGMTLDAAATEFFAMRELAERTEYNYRLMLQMAFGDWLQRPMKDITGEMVMRRFREVTEANGPAYANHATRAFRSIWNFARARFRAPNGGHLLPECPVQRISEARMWNRVERRQTLIKRTELPGWYRAVMELQSEAYPEAAEAVRDYLLLLLFTGLRRGEAAALMWLDVDFDEQCFTVVRTKNGSPLTLPMSHQLAEIFERRRARKAGEFVFPGRGSSGHMVDARKFLPVLRERSGVHFTHHDLRRTFITVAEGIDIPYYALKRLVNHSMSGDVTAGYIVRDVERLRDPMQRISNEIDRRCLDQ